MATVIQEDGTEVEAVALAPRRVRSAHPVSSIIALVILVAFALTCIVVFAGSRLGLRDPYPVEKAIEQVPTQPTPAAP
jgi:hypothetical protein